jgi:hypothetical protein
VSITHQIATRSPWYRPRHPGAPLQPAPPRRRLYALVRITGLMALAALGAAFLAGTVAIAIMVVASNLGG